MCYTLLLSTSSDRDLARSNSDRVHFSRDLPGIADARLLRYPHRWYVGSRSGCSCSFRHLHSVELGFGEPVDWYPEDPEDIAATLELVAVIRGLAEAGESVDCIDVWATAEPHPVVATAVDLAAVANEQFRLFENHQFVFARLLVRDR